jgi:hypothetical protein
MPTMPRSAAPGGRDQSASFGARVPVLARAPLDNCLRYAWP